MIRIKKILVISNTVNFQFLLPQNIGVVVRALGLPLGGHGFQSHKPKRGNYTHVEE